MKYLWNLISRLNICAEAKYRLAFAAAVLLSALAGFLVWLPACALAPSMHGQLLSFIGYPALFSLLAVYVRLGGHASGRKDRE